MTTTEPHCPECDFSNLLAMNPKHMRDPTAIRYFCPMCAWGCTQYPEGDLEAEDTEIPEWARGLGDQKHPDVPFCCSGDKPPEVLSDERGKF